MATSALIKVEGLKNVYLYKHYDGNPTYTLPWLEEFNKDFTQKRGDDPGYKFAQLLRSSIADATKFNLDPSRTTGWGVMNEDNVGVDYKYLLRKDGTVGVFNQNS